MFIGLPCLGGIIQEQSNMGAWVEVGQVKVGKLGRASKVGSKKLRPKG